MTETLLDSYSETNMSTYPAFEDVFPNNNSAFSQSFTTPNDGINYTLEKVTGYFRNYQSLSDAVIRAEIYLHAGTYGVSSVPTGAALATSEQLSASSVGSSFELKDLVFTGANRIKLSPNTHYVLVFKCVSRTTGTFNIGLDASSPTHSGNEAVYLTGAWFVQATYDLCFYVYGVMILTITTVSNVTTVPIEGTHDYASGSNVPVTATADVGYVLLRWILDSLNAGYLNPITVTMNADHTLTAVMVKYNSRLIDDIIQRFER